KVDSLMFIQLIPDLKMQKTYAYPSYDIDSSEIEMRSNILSKTAILKEMGLEVLAASNNWAVSGKKSETGMPILSNDMHLGFNAPGIWYQIHQNVKDGLNVTGVLLPGQPFILDGHNDNIAWGMTNIMLDDIDFYYETINPDNENQYKLDGQWKDMEILNEKIKLKDETVVEKTIKFTHRGPIVSNFKKIDNKSISMHWTGNEFSNEIRSIYLLNRAPNWNEFKDAISTFTAGNQNINYSDIQGNIGIYAAAGVPIRKGDPKSIYNGETSENDWTGFVPFDSLPHEFNPECGYVASANNKSVSEDYPFYISYWYDLSYRKDRIVEMLEEKEKLSIDDFKKMLADHKSKMVEDIIPKIIEPINKIENLDENQKEALKELNNWDGVYTTDSKAASIFEYFYINFVKNIVSDEMGNELYQDFIGDKILVRNMIFNLLRQKDSKWFDNINTKDKIETFDDIVQISFINSLDSLKEKLGAKILKWNWGYIHTLTIKHPLGKVNILDKLFGLNKGPFAVGGTYHTVAPYAYKFTDIFNVNHGASERHIFSTADWNESLTIIPTGICGIPASDHYCDQTKLYINDKFHSDYFDLDKIKKISKYKMELLPVK
ncbi:MAG: penicillin acylase family protein, partial [Bacteroidales bacterium]|nr:penicillin acylase family protein [Bacteroidales bacterium]